MNMIPSIYKHLSMSATDPYIEFTLQNHLHQQSTEYPQHFLSLIQLSQESFFSVTCVCSLFPKAILFDFYGSCNSFYQMIWYIHIKCI